MHIGKKIIDDISQTLAEEYHLTLTDEEYKIFTNPFYDDQEKFHRNDYKSRQCTSVGLMNKILGHDGKKILLFLSELAGMEPQIQELQPWNRDHVVHAIHVFFAGFYILKRIRLSDTYKTRYDLRLTWKLVAPTHDMGYPVEIAGNIQKEFIDIMNRTLAGINPDSIMLRNRMWPENLDTLCNGKSSNDLIQSRLNEWGLGIDVSDYYMWLQKRNRTEHGVIGALAQLRVLDAIYQEKNPNAPEEQSGNILKANDRNDPELDIVSAAASLFIHNIDVQYPGFTGKIKFQTAPVAFLLFLCDTFQEWDRYADRRTVFQGDGFDIEFRENKIYLNLPHQLEARLYEILNRRLQGFPIMVNDRLAVQ